MLHNLRINPWARFKAVQPNLWVNSCHHHSLRSICRNLQFSSLTFSSHYHPRRRYIRRIPRFLFHNPRLLFHSPRLLFHNHRFLFQSHRLLFHNHRFLFHNHRLHFRHLEHPIHHRKLNNSRS
jgi:hypothetical protein